MEKMIRNSVAAIFLALIFFGTGITFAQSDVTVVNLPASPVPVRNVNDAVQPFQIETFFSQHAGTNASIFDVAEIPAGKRLVIEFVSFEATLPAGQRLSNVSLTPSIGITGGKSFPLVVHEQPASVLGEPVFRSNQQVRIYADNLSPLRAFVRRNTSPGNASYRISVSGYLVDLP